MGNNSSSNSRHKKDPYQRTAENGTSYSNPADIRSASVPSLHSDRPPQTNPQFNMAALGREASVPVRPGLVSYNYPQNSRHSPAPSGGQSFERSQGRGQGRNLMLYIERAVSIWNDLEPLTFLPVNSLPDQTVGALERAFERLLENHTYATTISKDHDHLTKLNRNLSEEKEVLVNEIRERNSTIQELQSSLKAFMDSPRTGIPLPSHSRQGSDGMRSFLNTNMPPQHLSVNSSAGSDLLVLREKVAELEDLLKAQQVGTNGATPEEELERIGEIQTEYSNLETLALKQMKPIIDSVAKQLDEGEKFRLLFGVLLVATEKSNDMLESLKTGLRNLMHHPDRYLTGAHPAGDGNGENQLEYKSSLIVRENVKLFENTGNKEFIKTRDPRQRARLSHERINKIFSDLRELLNDGVDSCKLTSLEKEVTDALKADYGSSVHGSIWFDSKFTRFLGDSCRLAWKITLTNRNIELQFSPFESYSEKRHHAYRSEPSPKSRVEYFAWPVLVDMDSKYVLHRGQAHFS